MATDIAVDDQTKFAKPWTDVTMSRDYFDVPDDDRPFDCYLDGTHKRPLISRSEARRLWQQERDFTFFNMLMRSTTSYSSYWTDEIRNHKAQQKRAGDWYTQIERDRAARNEMLQRMEQERQKNAELLRTIQTMESASRDSATAEGRTES